MKYPLLLVAAAAFVLGAAPTHASEDLLSLSAGYYDISDNEEAVDFRAEYRWGEPLLWQIKPFLGVEATSDGAVYGLGGLLLDWGVAPHFYITPGIGAGLYHDGDGKDLGHVVEFRSQIEAAYEFENASRFSLGFSHISNAGLDDRNPGTEILSLYYHHPVGFMTGD